jgi:hypothetical protein
VNGNRTASRELLVSVYDVVDLALRQPRIAQLVVIDVGDHRRRRPAFLLQCGFLGDQVLAAFSAFSGGLYLY